MLPNDTFFAVGTFDGEALRDVFVATYPRADIRRWFFDEPLHHEGRTWVVSTMWGPKTAFALEGLAGLVPEAGISFAAA